MARDMLVGSQRVELFQVMHILRPGSYPLRAARCRVSEKRRHRPTSQRACGEYVRRVLEEVIAQPRLSAIAGLVEDHRMDIDPASTDRPYSTRTASQSVSRR